MVAAGNTAESDDFLNDRDVVVVVEEEDGTSYPRSKVGME